MRTLRLRQAVVAASDRDAVVARWQSELGIGEPFHDPGVQRFGLCNSVVPVGDTFLEVVSPLEAGGGSSAERFMARTGGDCGYMAIFQVEDMDDARRHLATTGVRTVLDIDLPEIRCTHIHPADIGAAIVSLDQPVPPDAWEWAGPSWPSEVHRHVVTGLAGITLASTVPDDLLRQWGVILDIIPDGDMLHLPDRTSVTVTARASTARTGLVGIDLWAARGVAPRSFELAGVEFRILAR